MARNNDGRRFRYALNDADFVWPRMSYHATIYNDKRKTFRRLKLAEGHLVFNAPLVQQEYLALFLRDCYGDRILEMYFQKDKSLCIKLRD